MSTLKKLSLTSLFLLCMILEVLALILYREFCQDVLECLSFSSVLLGSLWDSSISRLSLPLPPGYFPSVLHLALQNTRFTYEDWDLSFSFVISASLSICSVLWNNSCASSYQSTARDLNKVPAHCHPATGAQQRFKWSPKLNPCPTA